MKLAQVNELADRIPALHDLECELSELPCAPADWLADMDTDHDDLIRYAEKLRPCYDRLGRIIGQLAGLFILARFSGRFETDWTAVTRVMEQTRQTEADMHAVWVPKVARQHFAYLLLAFHKTAAVTCGFDANLRRSDLLREQLDGWTRELKVAGAMLSRAAAEKLGLLPVDFSQACCSCGAGKPQPFSLKL
ncbi:MAG: hypothetical protein ACOYNZ_01515 [Rhodoferax sp.]